MTVEVSSAADFMAGHARVLDRRRFELLQGETDNASGALAALDAYRNPDGGYGWGLEPDLRSPESQPAAAWHAFEVFENVAPVTSPRAVGLARARDALLHRRHRRHGRGAVRLRARILGALPRCRAREPSGGGRPHSEARRAHPGRREHPRQ